MTNEEVAKTLMKTLTQFRRMAKHPHGPPQHGPFEGLKPSDIGLLHLLSHHGEDHPQGSRISELSEQLKVTPSSVTQQVTSLENAGLVVRRMDPEDRRSVLVSLTDMGKESLRASFEHFIAMFTGLVDHMGAERGMQLNDLMAEAIEYFSKANRKGDE